MSKIVSQQELLAAVENQTFIKKGQKESVEGIKYDFRLGTNLLKSMGRWKGVSIDYTTLTAEQRLEMVIEPGEVVFVLTEEELDLPNDIIVSLLPKRKLSQDGIAVLGGMAVDPLYKGNLLIGMHNISSESYVLKPGKKLIGARFHRLESEEIGDFEPPEVEIFNEFPEHLVDLVKKYRPILPEQVVETISNLEAELNRLKDEINNDKSWKKNFQENLDKQNETLKKQSDEVQEILEALKFETKNREQGDSEIAKQFREFEKERSDSLLKLTETIGEIKASTKINAWTLTAIIAVAAFLAALLIGILAWQFPKIMNP